MIRAVIVIAAVMLPGLALADGWGAFGRAGFRVTCCEIIPRPR